jgi:hypothetical protein
MRIVVVGRLIVLVVSYRHLLSLINLVFAVHFSALFEHLMLFVIRHLTIFIMHYSKLVEYLIETVFLKLIKRVVIWHNLINFGGAMLLIFLEIVYFREHSTMLFLML